MENKKNIIQSLKEKYYSDYDLLFTIFDKLKDRVNSTENFGNVHLENYDKLKELFNEYSQVITAIRKDKKKT